MEPSRITLILNIIGRTHVITFFTLTSYCFRMSTPIRKLEMIVCTIRKLSLVNGRSEVVAVELERSRPINRRRYVQLYMKLGAGGGGVWVTNLYGCPCCWVPELSRKMRSVLTCGDKNYWGIKTNQKVHERMGTCGPQTGSPDSIHSFHHFTCSCISAIHTVHPL